VPADRACRQSHYASEPSVRAQNLDLDLVERRNAAHEVEIFALRLIADQIVAVHVVESIGETPAEVVIVVKENAASPARQLIETFLADAKCRLAACFRTPDDLDLALLRASALIHGT
jgi:hypothetical protein